MDLLKNLEGESIYSAAFCVQADLSSSLRTERCQDEVCSGLGKPCALQRPLPVCGRGVSSDPQGTWATPIPVYATFSLYIHTCGKVYFINRPSKIKIINQDNYINAL